MFWFTVFVIVPCLAGLFIWFWSQTKESKILNALEILNNSKHDKGLDGAGVCDLLATAGKALSDHSEQLGSFERSLSTADVGRSAFSSLGEIQKANQSVEQTIDKTIAELIASCGDLLSEEQSSLKAYREKNSEFGSKLDSITHVKLLVQFAGTLLDMVRELRAENKVVRDEVASCREKIIQLVTCCSGRKLIKSGFTNPPLPAETYSSINAPVVPS